MAKVNIEKSLHERVKKVAASEGYSSVDEFIAHAIENELTRSDANAAEEQVAGQLRGLGYIE
jgi:metal-responsive CopG/Arc/MetJ family transcriptional regulator